MFTISRKLLSGTVVLLLLLSLGLNVGPAQASANPCEPAYVKVRDNQFTVRPSGTDDTANLQCALDTAKAAGAGSTVQLVKGNYQTGFIDVAGFDGTFKGAGIGKTVITPLANLDCLALSAQNILPSLFTFRLGNPRILDMTISIDKPTCTDVSSVIYLTGSKLGTGDPCANLKPEHGKGTIARVEVTTPWQSGFGLLGITIKPEFNWLPAVNNACHAQFSGDYQITDSIIDGFYTGGTGVLTGTYGKSNILIDHNTFIHNWYGFIDEGVDGLNLEVSRNTFSQNWAALIGQSGNFTNLPPGKPVNYHFHHNAISIDPGLDIAVGVIVADGANINYQQPIVKAVVDHNTVTAAGLNHIGFWITGVKNILVAQNTVKGTGGGGFIFDDLWYGTGPVENAMIVKNDLSQFSLSSAPWFAPIWLGAVTNHCTVIGQNLTDIVVDLGADNILVNMH
jgi:hypothetical protein